MQLKLLNRVANAFDALEGGALLLIGTAAFATLVVGVPALLAWELYRDGQLLIAGLVVVLVVLLAIRLARDLSARRLSWFSAGLAVLWLLCIAYVGLRTILD